MVTDLAGKIRDLLPKDGSTIGNISLIRKLGVQPEEYIVARSELELQHLIVRGVGRGGTVRLARPLPEAVKAERAGGVKNEAELYGPLKNWFDKFWGSDYRAPDFYACKITGSPRGHKRRGGKWSRPDLSIVTVAGAEFFVPNKNLEVTTVEVKRYNDIGVSAVFEAASHKKFGHQSYVALEWLEPTDMDKADSSDVASDVLREARQFEVGVLQLRYKNAALDIQEILEPIRKNPDPSECSAFIERNFKDYTKLIAAALR